MVKVNKKALSAFIENYMKEMEELQVQLRKKGQDAIEHLWKELSKEVPSLGAIVWTQYTPYFNDGEECHFGVNEPEFYALTAGEVDEEYDPAYGSSELPLGNKWIPQDMTFEEFQKKYGKWYDKNDFDTRQKMSALITQEQANILAEVSALLQSGEFSDTLQYVYDNHVRVTILLTADGVKTRTESYDHE